MPAHPTRRTVPVAVLVASTLAVAAGPVRAGPDPGLRPPVDAPVVDPFRAPPTPYAAGNRGLEYSTEPGTPVRSAGSGEVTFAGPVAGTLHVTVLHPDGLRSTVSFLASVTVRRGDRVEQGDVVGTAGARLHLGVRSGEVYLDPAALMAGRPGARVRLVPIEEGQSGVAAERAAIAGWLAADRPSSLHRAGRWLGGRLQATGSLLAHYAPVLDPTRFAVATGAELFERLSERAPCTPAAVPPPRSSLGGRRVAVLVGGLGSTSESAAVDGVDTAALGYEAGDVYRFSYAGGRVPDESDRHQDIAASAYDATDSQVDLHSSAAGLERLLGELAVRDPGVPIDVVAHSQGGLVTRLALDRMHRSGELERLGAVVTLATPHEGADLATAAAALRTDPTLTALVGGAGRAIDVGIAPTSRSVEQLSELGEVVTHLVAVGVPEGVSFTSVGARGDLVVPATRTRVDGAPHVVVPLDRPDAHDALPASPDATRELALAIAGRPPTCESPADVALDVVAGQVVAQVTDGVGLGVLLAGAAVPG